MKKLLIGTSILLLASCMSSIMDDPLKVIDPELEPYYQMFLDEAQLRGHDFSRANVEILFKPLEGLNGHASKREGYILIEIDPIPWSNNGPIFKEVLMMHEFGHAFLYREHSDDCSSVMKVLDNCRYTYYENNRTKALDELFDNK